MSGSLSPTRFLPHMSVAGELCLVGACQAQGAPDVVRLQVDSGSHHPRSQNHTSALTAAEDGATGGQ